MKKFLILILVLFSFGLASCDASEKDPCADGHDWEDATYTEPKTCRNCGETQGKPLTQDINTLRKAMEELNKGNFTSVITQTMDGYAELSGTTKVSSTSDKMLMESESMGSKIKYYFEMNEEMVTMWQYNDTSSEWSYFSEIDISEFEEMYNQDPLQDITPEMFTLKNGIWVGNIELIEKQVNDLLGQFISTANVKINQYDITLDTSGNIKTIKLNMAVTYTYGDQPTTMVMSTNYKYSKIGKTTLERPSGIVTE